MIKIQLSSIYGSMNPSGKSDIFNIIYKEGKSIMKKKKKNKDTYSVAEQNIKILKSGKIKIKKGQKISLTPYVKESADNAIVSRLDAILPKGDVVIDTANCRLESDVTISSMRRTVELLTRGDSSKVYTLTHVVSKKDATDVFDFMDDSIIGSLIRSSTLASIYKEIKKAWVELHDKDNTSFTNVMFIPKILVFLDESTGKIKKQPFTINLLLISEPSLKAMADGIEEVTKEDAVKRIVTDTITAAIKCAAKNLMVNPYCHKLLYFDEHYTAELWYSVIGQQKTIEGLDSVDFTINDDDLYIIFTKSKK